MDWPAPSASFPVPPPVACLTCGRTKCASTLVSVHLLTNLIPVTLLHYPGLFFLCFFSLHIRETLRITLDTLLSLDINCDMSMSKAFSMQFPCLNNPPNGLMAAIPPPSQMRSITLICQNSVMTGLIATLNGEGRNITGELWYMTRQGAKNRKDKYLKKRGAT